MTVAPRLGFSLRALRSMHPAACDGDPRLVWRKDDEGVVGVVTLDGEHHQLGGMYPRQLRLLGLQMIALADLREHEPAEIEVVIP